MKNIPSSITSKQVIIMIILARTDWVYTGLFLALCFVILFNSRINIYDYIANYSKTQCLKKPFIASEFPEIKNGGAVQLWFFGWSFSKRQKPSVLMITEVLEIGTQAGAKELSGSRFWLVPWRGGNNDPAEDEWEEVDYKTINLSACLPQCAWCPVLDKNWTSANSSWRNKARTNIYETQASKW